MARSKRKSHRTLWLVLFLIALAAAGGGFYYYQITTRAAANATTTATLKTAKVKKGDITITANGTAKFVPTAEIDLAFKSGGRLVEMLVKPGAIVTAGQPLARLDDADARAQITKAQIDLALAEVKLAAIKAIDPLDVAVARADLEKVTVNLRKAQQDYNAVAWRSDVGMLPQATALEQATLDYQKAKATYDLKMAPPKETDLRTAQLQIDQAKAALSSAQAALDNLTLKAPIAGVVLVVKADAGEQVGATPIITLVDLSKPTISIAIDETDLSKVAVGLPIEMTFDALPDKTIQGAIVAIDPTVVLVSGIPTLYATAELKNPPANLKIGMGGAVKITAASAKQVLTVPVEAVREIAPGQFAVFVVGDNQQLVLRTVEIGLRGTSAVEIKSGLQLGETVSTGTVSTQ